MTSVEWPPKIISRWLLGDTVRMTMVDSKGTKSDMICLPPGKTGNPLCIQEGKQCSRVNLSQFLLKAASITSSFSLNRKKKTTITWTTLSPMQITECGSQRGRFNSRCCSHTFWWTEQVEYTTLFTKGNDRAWFNTDNWNLASDSSLFCKQNEK